MKKTAMLFFAIMLSAMGTDVRSTSLRTDQPTGVPQNASSWAMGTSESSIPSENCPGAPGYLRTRKKIGPLQSLSDSASCTELWSELIDFQGNSQWQDLYDSGKEYVENCNNNQHFINAFTELSAAVQQLSIFTEYRTWLETALYLNTSNPQYFCACAEAIAGTYQSVNDTTETLYWKDENRELAVYRWLINNTNCDSASNVLQSRFNNIRQSQYDDWLNDTLIPLDTTLPSLAELGLDTLFQRHFLYASVSETPQPSIISNATANPNPTGEGTVISFGISQEAYVKIELFDILGHEVGSTGFESLFEPGNKSVPLSLVGLQAGTYFARILTAYGEAQSVKLVKE